MAEAGNITVVTSLDPTVGNGGGWVLGGGHGPLTSLRGLGADQVLSLNVVTADGRFITADLNQNQDLFFALRGGGGGESVSLPPQWVSLTGFTRYIRRRHLPGRQSVARAD
jgi:hypothetical protein